MHESWEKVRISKLSKGELINELKEENFVLKTKNKELEHKIDHLRVSRRVLMNLLEKVERENKRTISNLERALELERQTKRRLIRQNHPVRLALVDSLPLTLEQHCKNVDMELERMGCELSEKYDAEYYLQEARKGD